MKDITGKTEKDLQVMLAQKQDALRVFRFGISGTKIRNVKEGRSIKKAIAQIKTELNRTAPKA